MGPALWEESSLANDDAVCCERERHMFSAREAFNEP